MRLSQVVFSLIDEGCLWRFAKVLFHSGLSTAAKTYTRVGCLLQVGISKVKCH